MEPVKLLRWDKHRLVHVLGQVTIAGYQASSGGVDEVQIPGDQLTNAGSEPLWAYWQRSFWLSVIRLLTSKTLPV